MATSFCQDYANSVANATNHNRKQKCIANSVCACIARSCMVDDFGGGLNKFNNKIWCQLQFKPLSEPKKKQYIKIYVIYNTTVWLADVDRVSFFFVAFSSRVSVFHCMATVDFWWIFFGASWNCCNFALAFHLLNVCCWLFHRLAVSMRRKLTPPV